MNVSLSPVSTTLPDLSGTALQVMPYVYDGSATVLDYPWRPHLRNVDSANKRYVFDAASCQNVALYLRGSGYRRAIFDMEPTPQYGGWSPANVAICGQIVAEFASYGVAMALWGLGTDALANTFGATLAKAAPFLAPALYPYTANVDQWLADRGRRLLRLRKENRKDATVILSPQYPDRTLVPAADLERMMEWGVTNGDDVNVWLNCGIAPFSLPDEHLAVLKKWAKH